MMRLDGSAHELPAGDSRKSGTQAEINAGTWSTGRYLKAYDNTALQPAEAVILSRYREALTGRVLDVGCGGGRILAYLLLLGAEAQGVDISTRMVEHCRQRFPGADVRVGDVADLKATVDGPYDAIVMSDNLIDVFNDQERRRVLADLRKLLSPDGRLVFSSHNLDGWDHRPTGRGSATAVLREAARRSPASWIRTVIDFPAVRRNRRRLGPLQYREGDHAVINDAAHHYGLLHYYIGRLDQERQLTELGFGVLEVLEADGSTVATGEAGQSSSLYYVATAQPTAVP